MSNTNPLRYPNTNSPQAMTTRAWWLVGLNFVVPGSPQLLVGNRQWGKFAIGATVFGLACLIVLPILSLIMPPVAHFFATWGPTLALAQFIIFLYGVMWIGCTVDTLRLMQLPLAGPRVRWWILAVTLLVLIGTAGTALTVAWRGL